MDTELVKIAWVVFWIIVVVFIARPMLGSIAFHYFQWRNRAQAHKSTRIQLELRHDTPLDLYCWYFDHRKKLKRDQLRALYAFVRSEKKKLSPSRKMDHDHYWTIMKEVRPQAYLRWRLWDGLVDFLALDTLVWRLRRSIFPRKRK